MQPQLLIRHALTAALITHSSSSSHKSAAVATTFRQSHSFRLAEFLYLLEILLIGAPFSWEFIDTQWFRFLRFNFEPLVLLHAHY